MYVCVHVCGVSTAEHIQGRLNMPATYSWNGADGRGDREPGVCEPVQHNVNEEPLNARARTHTLTSSHPFSSKMEATDASK